MSCDWTQECSLDGASAIADLAVADCSVADVEESTSEDWTNATAQTC